MMLTDREWLRFVTFAIVAGGGLGSVYTGALFLIGNPPVWAIAGGVVAGGVIGLIAHLAIRYVLDRASEPPAEETNTEDTA